MPAEIKSGAVLMSALIVDRVEVTLDQMVESLTSASRSAQRKLWRRVSMNLFDEVNRQFVRARVAITVLHYPIMGKATPFEGEIMSVSETSHVFLLGTCVRGTIHLVGPRDASKPQGRLECYDPETDK